MRMTNKEIAELLLKMNEDCSNVECYAETHKHWTRTMYSDVASILLGIVNNGECYRIEDNSVKELNIGLYKEVFKRRGSEGYTATIQNIDLDGNKVWIDSAWNSLESLNKHWELVD